MRDYWKPLGTVEPEDFNQYLSALETTLEDRLDQEYSFEHELYDTNSTSAVIRSEQVIYRDFLDQLGDIETKTELFNYVEDSIELSDEGVLPGPLKVLTRPIDRMFESHREQLFKDLFRQAKQEFEQK